jgi:hypothetical protein
MIQAAGYIEYFLRVFIFEIIFHLSFTWVYLFVDPTLLR